MSSFIGRSLAMCAHPSATWRSRSIRRRIFVLFAYAVGGYAVVLAGLYAIG